MYRIIQKIYNWIVFRCAWLRGKFWGLFLHSVGERVFVLKGVTFTSPKGISIGHDVSINRNATLDGHGELKIGNYVLIAPYVTILTANHGFSNPLIPMTCQDISNGIVTIEDDVWIGTNAVILPNVRISRGSVVGANAVVTRDDGAYSIVGGVPAKFIKSRFDDILKEKASKADFSKFKIK